MKKLLTVILSIMMLFSSMGFTALAETETLSANVYVSIADEQGELVLAQEKITVVDIDEDQKLTINDALYAAHEAGYEGGAEQGYKSGDEGYEGSSLVKLWGIENGGSYGYYVNNKSAWSLLDTVKTGDYINAFIYTDLTTWSDKYTYFGVNTVSADPNKDIELVLSAAGYDLEYNPIALPVEGAVITVNGEKTDVKTDAEGKATIRIAEGGEYVISAVSDTETLVPPVCVATVSTNDTAKVYVTVSDEEGKLALIQEEVTVSDADKDGALTINDALYAAHEAGYEGGAAAGYGSSYGDYGLSLNMLWGTANGGSYGYYLNNTSAWSLADLVKDGDYVNAFVYTDLTAWSDKYCYFDKNTVTTTAGKEVTLTLSANGYDADWNPIVVPVEGATITLNGEKTEFKTDKSGKVIITPAAEGTYVISAVSDAEILVPPVCKAVVSAVPEAETEVIPSTGDSSNIVLFGLLAVISLSVITVILAMRKKSYEK